MPGHRSNKFRAPQPDDNVQIGEMGTTGPLWVRPTLPRASRRTRDNDGVKGRLGAIGPRGRTVIAVVGAAVLFGGGILQGDNLQGANKGPTTPRPAYASGRGLAPQSNQVTVVCTTMTGSVSGPLTLGGCNKPAATGGSGTIPGSVLRTSGSGTVIWNGTGQTTFLFSSTPTTDRRDKCGGGTEVVVRGSVTGNRSIGAGNPGVKGAVRAKVCLDSALNASLLAGRPFRF